MSMYGPFKSKRLEDMDTTEHNGTLTAVGDAINYIFQVLPQLAE
jgi:hypothetical protein